jgi:hypothetical protein
LSYHLSLSEVLYKVLRPCPSSAAFQSQTLPPSPNAASHAAAASQEKAARARMVHLLHTLLLKENGAPAALEAIVSLRAVFNKALLEHAGPTHLRRKPPLHLLCGQNADTLRNPTPLLVVTLPLRTNCTRPD